jgi:hypothetical protein
MGGGALKILLAPVPEFFGRICINIRTLPRKCILRSLTRQGAGGGGGDMIPYTELKQTGSTDIVA